MTFFPDGKTFLEINLGSFHLTIAMYAILILGGALLAYYLSLRNLRKIGYKDEFLEDWFIIMLPLSIIGARVWYVIFEWQLFADDPVSAFYIWNGGLAIQGGLIVGIIYSYIYFRKKGANFLRVGDCIMPNVLLAQAIGRWGNFFNQEAFGQIVSEKYFRFFPEFIKKQMFIDGAYRQPMFLIEGIGNVFGWIIITFVYKRFGRNKRGDLIYAYLVWYGFIRFFVEASRSDSLMFAGLKVAQMLSILFVIIGALGIIGAYDSWFKNHYPFKHEQPALLFDLDGTLIDTLPLIRESFKYTFKQYPLDHEVSDEEIDSYFGPTLRDSFRKHYPEEMIDEVIETYRKHNSTYHEKYVKSLPNVKETLLSLKEEGYAMAIVSNKLESMIRLGLQVAGLEGIFDVIVDGEETKAIKPKPSSDPLLLACELLRVSHDDVIYIGDSVGDVQAARNMGAYSIAYVYNKKFEDQLLASKPCRVIRDLSELKTIVKEDREWSEFVI